MNYLFEAHDALEVARMILRGGYFDNEIPLVVPEGGRYVLLEGNRRLAALRALRNPSLVPSYQATLERLLKRYASEAADLPATIRVMVVDSRAAAAPHLARLHVGENKRAWDLDEQAKFVLAQLVDGVDVNTLKTLLPGIPSVPRLVRMGRMRELLERTEFQNPAVAEYSHRDLKMSVFEYAYKDATFQKLMGLSFAADGAPPYEEIANLTPDLIVGLYSDLTDTQYARLSQIAPTLAQPKDTNDYAATWEQITPILARALDEKAKGDQLLAQTREKIAETKSTYPQFEGKTGLSVYRNEDGYSVSAANDPRGQFLQMLGFTQSAAIKDALGENFDATISFERADLIDADVLVWEPKDVAALKAELAADPIFSRLRVAREDRSVFIQGGSDASCAYYFASVLSIPYLLDRLAPQIAVAIDGNPNTVPAIVT